MYNGLPFHQNNHNKAIGTETKKTVRMDESTENTRRIVTVEQTSRIIKYGDNQEDQHQERNKNFSYSVPMPKKFVQGQFRESDYESDVDIGRIRAKWSAPSESETEEPRYRRVQGPRSKVTRSPVVTMPSESETEYHDIRRSSNGQIDRTMTQLVPGSPPEYVYTGGRNRKAIMNRWKHFSSFSSSFLARICIFRNTLISYKEKKKIFYIHIYLSARHRTLTNYILCFEMRFIYYIISLR